MFSRILLCKMSDIIVSVSQLRRKFFQAHIEFWIYMRSLQALANHLLFFQFGQAARRALPLRNRNQDCRGVLRCIRMTGPRRSFVNT